MNNGVLIWIVIFAVSTIGFFLISVVVAIKGFFDLRLLLNRSNRNRESQPNSENVEDNFRH